MPERPPIPPEVARELREEAGFGCCKCGAGIYDYHHIIEWNKIQQHDPEHMMLLCPNHHRFVGDQSPEDQYEIKADPKNIRDGHPNGKLVVRRGQERKFDLGHNYIVPRGFESLLAIDDVSVLAGGFDVHGRVHLSLSLYDECDRLLAEIIDNRWIAIADLLWDVIAQNCYLKIRQRERKILLEIDLTKGVPFIQGHFWRCGKRIWIKRRCIRIGQFKISGIVVEGRGISVESRPGGRIGIGIG